MRTLTALMFTGCMLVVIIEESYAAMCGSTFYQPPENECCGKGTQNIVYHVQTEMCLRDIWSGIYHTRSKLFQCGSLKKKYNYLTELCLQDITTKAYRIIPRFAYCGGARFDLRYHFCYYDFMTGRFKLSSRSGNAGK